MKRDLCKPGRLALLVLLALFTLSLLVPFTAIAQSPCEQTVVDSAGVFGNRTADVEAAARNLASSGADVRVRIVQTYGSAGNLDRYESQLEQQCPSWTDAGGNRKNNLVVILVSIQERQTGLYYGSQWENALGSRWTQIQTNTMNPRFQQGDFAGGVIAGLNEINRLITAQASGPVSTPSSGGFPAGQVALIFLLVLLFFFVLPIGLFLFIRYRKSKERRLAAQQKARLAKQGAAAKVNSLVDAVQMLEIKVNATAAKVSPEDVAPLLDGLNKAKNLVDQGAQTYSELNHSAGNPDDPKLGEAQLGVVAQEYQKVTDTLREASSEVGQVEAGIATLQQAADSYDSRAAEVKTAIESAANKQEGAKKTGFKASEPAEMLARARKLLEQAAALAQSKKFIQAMKALNDAGDLAAQADKYIDELPQKKLDAEAAIKALANRIDLVKETISKGRDTFDRVSSTYAESSWESIRGNGTEAENRTDWTLEALDDARIAASMDQQEWNKALELVAQGNSWLDEAEVFMHSISAVETSLAAARRDAPGEIAAAQADITTAWNYIYKYDDDIRESLEDDLREAEKKLSAANEELRNEKADFVKVVKLARDANESSDKILAQARSEHETAERLRSKVAGAIRDARSKVTIAREYIEDHRRDAGDEARRYLDSAVTALHQAETSADLNSQLSLAEKAESDASKAYSSARARVQAEQARRQPMIPPIIIVPGSGSHGGGSPWGSRRGSPFGMGGGGGPRVGGGGSTGWGGGRGGGGSTGW